MPGRHRAEQQRCRSMTSADVVSYADDFIILSRGRAAQALTWTKAVTTKLGLTLNEAKTSPRNARQGNGVTPNGLSYRAHPRLYLKRPAVAPAEGLLTEVVLKHTRVVPNSPPMTPGRHGGCSRTTAQAVPIVSAIATRPVTCQRSRRVKRSQRETAPRWRECRGQSPRPRASARGRDIRHSAQNWAAPVPRRPRGSLAVQTIAR